MSQHVYITMFQKFTFTFNEKCIDSEKIKSEKLVKLFAYLVSYDHRAVPSSELIDYLWDLDNVDNPVGALKNLVYRLRRILKENFAISDFIITGKGSYAINDSYELHLDTEEFEKNAVLLDNPENQTAENYELFLNQYTGKYLTEIKDDHNILDKRVYYHALFVDHAIDYCDFLEQNQQYERMETIARRIIDIDNLDEYVYEILIRSLYLQKKYKKAKEAYRRTVDWLYQSLGVKVSESMQELFEMIKKEEHDDEMDIFAVQEELNEDESDGAFFCEYGTFREIYAMQSRMIGRLGICSHMCLITLFDEEQEQIDKKITDKTMIKIQNALLEGLRIGDVVSRIGINQFIILLPTCNYENAINVMNRVLRKIKYSLKNTTCDIDLMIEEVLPKS